MPRFSPLIAALAAGPVLALGLSTAPCAAQAQVPSNAGLSPLGDALKASLRDGLPTVVVVTSTTQPASLQFRDALVASAAGRGIAQRCRFAELSAEANPERVRTLGIARFPSLLVYLPGSDGSFVLAAHRLGPIDAFTAVGWLGGLDLAAHAPTDPSVVRTNYNDGAQATGQGFPSPQYPTAPPKAPPAAPPMAPPSYAPPMMYAPPVQYAAPVPAPAPVILQPASPTMVVQQQPQQIVLAPAPPPQITVAMAPSSGPSVTYAMAPPTASAPPNLFMAPPASAPPAYAPPVASAPPAMAPVMMAPVAMAPQPAMAPPASAPPNVGQGPIAATVLTAVLTNPSLLNRLIGTLGEHLAQKKNPRIQMGQSPFSQAPVSQAPVALAPAGQAPMAYAPMGYAPQGQPAYAFVPNAPGYAPYGAMPYPGYAPPPEQYPTPPAYPQYEAPRPIPTPQAGPPVPSKHWSLFHR